MTRGYRRLSSLPPLFGFGLSVVLAFFGQALVRPFVCARVVVFYNYFGRFWLLLKPQQYRYSQRYVTIFV